MEHKDEMQPAMNAENISEAQEAPKEYAAEVPEQEAAKEGAKKGQEILTKIKDAFSAEKWEKSAAILGAAVVVIAAAIALLGRGSAASVAKRYCDSLLGNAKMRVGLTAYDWKARQLGYYDDDEDDFFKAMSDQYDEDITSWGSFFKAKNKSDKETIEDLVGKYKITTEVTRTKDISVKKLLKENSRLIEGLEAKGLIDRDDISAAKEIIVKMKMEGEDQTVRNTYDMYLVKIGGAWKVLDYDVDSDYDD